MGELLVLVLLLLLLEVYVSSLSFSATIKTVQY
jgi:hypothetical protein